MPPNGPLDLFGPFVDVSRGVGGGPPPSPAGGRARRDTVFPPDLRFDALFLSGGPEVRVRRCATWPCSLVLHTAAAAALIVGPLLASSELPGAAGAVQAFFVQPMVAPPPPPPPPPPAARPTATRAVVARAANDAEAFVAPVEVPTDITPEAGLDLDIEGGLAGGVEGGVPGGVVGGIVGGLPEADMTPPPVAPVRVGGRIKAPVKVTHVDPVYPEVARDAGIEGVVIIETVIGANGRITSARILRGVPMLEEAALEAVRRWVYTPTLLDGVPMPVVMTVTVNFQINRDR